MRHFKSKKYSSINIIKRLLGDYSVLNTILYNSNEGIKNEVNRRLRNTPPTSAAAIVSTRPSVKDNATISGVTKKQLSELQFLLPP